MQTPSSPPYGRHVVECLRRTRPEAEVDGRVTIVSMDINVPDRFNSVTAPIPGTRHVNPTRRRGPYLAETQGRPRRRAPTPLFDATLALIVSANRIFVHGRGINAEIAGDLRRQSARRVNPHVTGGFDLLRGSLSLLASALSLPAASFNSMADATPDLDLVAETTPDDITRASGYRPGGAADVCDHLHPSLPEDEILSRVLFQRSSGSLSPFQALELANAAASLSGRGDAFERLRRSLGFNSLNIGSSAGGGPRLVSAAPSTTGSASGDDRREAAGQRRIRRSRRHPTYPASGRRRCKRRIERRHRSRLGVQIAQEP